MRPGTCVYLIYRDVPGNMIEVEGYEDSTEALRVLNEKYEVKHETWRFHPIPVEITVKPI